MLLYDWIWRGHLTNKKEGCTERCAEGCTEGCMEGCAEGCTEGCMEGCAEGHMEGCAEGLPLATINLVGDNREFEV